MFGWCFSQPCSTGFMLGSGAVHVHCIGGGGGGAAVFHNAGAALSYCYCCVSALLHSSSSHTCKEVIHVGNVRNPVPCAFSVGFVWIRSSHIQAVRRDACTLDLLSYHRVCSQSCWCASALLLVLLLRFNFILRSSSVLNYCSV